MSTPRLRVLFFVEGLTDIRFVTGLSEICDLTLAVSGPPYRQSLAGRVAQANLKIAVDEIPGGRIAFQLRSLSYLWRRMRDFDVVISQEVLRGSLNATLVGRLRSVPVAVYMGISPAEYFRCRWERRQINLVTALIGEGVIRSLMRVNGLLATAWLVMGSYLESVARHYTSDVAIGRYYGVDTSYYTPSDPSQRAALRRRLGLPEHAFIVFFPSRISHEKDPETVIQAATLARQRGLDVVVVNTSGGFDGFTAVAGRLGVPAGAAWVVARPAAHPVTELADYYRVADVVACASLAEGLGLAPLEALACGTPVVATAVGGLAVHPTDVLTLTPRRDATAMAAAFQWVAENPAAAKAQALRGRAYVVQTWGRERAFAELADVLERVRASGRRSET
jgi:glycosyltransferase involved in cell wall biosynthesis